MTASALFIFAHPDDESFSSAGTALEYKSAGIRTALVTATRGERGKVGDPPVCTPDERPACRERELREAADVIGFDELHLLGYRDRELADAPPTDVRRTLVSLIRRIRPVIVHTFDPNGFNVHPDHVAISRFTSDAIAVATDPRWYPEEGDAHVVSRLVWIPPIGPWETPRGDRLPAQYGADFVIDITPWRDQKIAALRAHRTQHLSVEKYFFNQPDPDWVLSTELWRQAWGPRLLRRPSSDLLDGLT